MFARSFVRFAAIAAVYAFVTVPPHAQRPAASPEAPFTLAQVKSYPFPTELTAAASGTRVAWAFEEAGVRNVYVAAPEWKARQLTHYAQDDGQELTSAQLWATDSIHNIDPAIEYVVGIFQDDVPVTATKHFAKQHLKVLANRFEGLQE